MQYTLNVIQKHLMSEVNIDDDEDYVTSISSKDPSIIREEESTNLVKTDTMFKTE